MIQTELTWPRVSTQLQHRVVADVDVVIAVVVVVVVGVVVVVFVVVV